MTAAEPRSQKTEDRSQNAALAALADELGQLELEYNVALAAWPGKVARMEALRKQLRAACIAKPGEEWIVEGTRFIAALGAQSMERTIDLPKLYKRIGARAFMKFASCTLKDLEKFCDAETVAEVVASSQTGTRRVVMQEKGAVS